MPFRMSWFVLPRVILLFCTGSTIQGGKRVGAASVQTARSAPR